MQESSMSISVNGQSQVPPGFRFHPTEEELLNYYLRKKVLYEKIDLDVIRDVDLNKLEPWDIQEKCRIGSTPQNDWYFFSHKDKKYPTGTRTNRATAAGFWKATGRDKVIHSSFQRIGMRKTLVFYKGRAPHGQKSDWIMHEYRLDETTSDTQLSNAAAEAAQEEGWVVCRIFKKKNLHKTLESSPMSSSSMNAETRTQLLNSSDEGALEQIFQHMGRTCKDANSQVNIEPNNNSRRFLRPIDTAAINNGGDDSGGATFHDRIFMKLPTLESPNSTTSQNFYQPIIHVQMIQENEAAAPPNPITAHSVYHHHLDTAALTDDWAALDRLVASHLNGQTDTSMPPFSSPSAAEYNDQDLLRPPPPPPRSAARAYHPTQDYNSEIDLWSFTRTCLQQSSDPLCHISNTPA